MPTPLFAPSERPDEPLTAGAPFGPGAGPTMNMAAGPRPSQSLMKLARRDATGEFEALALMLAQRGL